jgi:hypothetical protein
LRPLRICLFSTQACRFLMLSIGDFSLVNL